MKTKIIGINLLILLIYSIIFFPKNVYLGIIEYSLCSFGHGIILLILAIIFFVRKQPERGKAFLLSLLLVAVIGGSVCSTGW